MLSDSCRAEFGVGLIDAGRDVLHLLPPSAHVTSSSSPGAADFLEKAELAVHPSSTAPHSAGSVLQGPGAGTQQELLVQLQTPPAWAAHQE